MEQELLTLPDHLNSASNFSGVGGRVYLSLVFCVMFCRSLLILLGLILLSMDCLSFFDLRFLIIPTVSSNFSSESLVSDWLKVPVQMIFTSYK